MPDIYAYWLPMPGERVARFAQATTAVRRAVGQAVGVEIDGDHGSAVGAQAATLRWRLLAAPGPRPVPGDMVWTLLWETPFTGDPGTAWIMTVKVGLDGDRAWVIVRLGVVTGGFRMSPIPLGVEPPPLVLALLRDLEIQEDGQALAAEPCHASDPDDAGHLAELLLDPDRILPVIVTSSAPGGARDNAVDPAGIARTLAGAAHVVVLDSNQASRALTARLGNQLTVFGGAVRLYWPGLTTTSDPRGHMLWLPRILDGGPGPPLRRQLLDHLMPVAVLRFSSVALEARITLAIERERRAELHRLSARAKEASLAVDWEHELEAAWSENERLREECAGLSARLEAARHTLRAVTSTMVVPPGAGGDVDTDAPGPGSVLEAVEWAEERCPNLVILEEARTSARRATYRQPGRVFKALVALDAAVLAWQQDELDGGFRRVLAEQGVDYGHSLSSAAIGRFPHEYERTYQGRRVALGPHIRLGRGSPEACCRIYLHLDEAARIAVVGHVGNHLSDRTTG